MKSVEGSAGLKQVKSKTISTALNITEHLDTGEPSGDVDVEDGWQIMALLLHYALMHRQNYFRTKLAMLMYGHAFEKCEIESFFFMKNVVQTLYFDKAKINVNKKANITKNIGII